MSTTSTETTLEQQALLIEGRCNQTGAKGATDRDGDLDVIVGQKSVKVHSISRPAGGDWVTETS